MSTALSRRISCIAQRIASNQIRRFSTNLNAAASLSASEESSPAKVLDLPLESSDPELYDLIQQEKRRQRDSINLIPSENFTSRAVMQALGSVFQNKYSEGYPGARYYGGNEIIDQVESLCQKRALEAYRLDESLWGVNVQALSGSPANLYVYGAILQPHERLMGLDLPSGGHLSHGYATPTKSISHVSTYYTQMPYRVNPFTGLIDYDQLQHDVSLFRPKILVTGASAYPRNIDYKRMRDIADSVNAYLMIDMAHLSGMIAANVLPSPFEYADIVTTTTHKSLRGPRGAMIFFRKGQRGIGKGGKPILYDLEERINFSVFPGHQGGPHNHTIAALATALKLASQPEFIEYQKSVLRNAQTLATSLQQLGYDLVAGGTDTHLLLVDLHRAGVDGARVERVLELSRMTVNKNTIPTDTSAMIPHGLRLGTPAMTTRGVVKDEEWRRIAKFVDRGVRLAKTLDSGVKGRKFKDFKAAVSLEESVELQTLRAEVVSFARQFPVAD